MPRQITKVFCAVVLLISTTAQASASIDHAWSDSAKQAVGTAHGRKTSKVWFTLGHGIVNEVYFPRIDTAQVGDSQLLFANVPDSFFLEEKRDFAHEVKHPPAIPRPLVRGTYGEGANRIEFIKEVITDPAVAALRIRYRFLALPEGVKIFVLHKPAVDNDGAHDMGRVKSFSGGKAFIAWDDEAKKSFQAVVTSVPANRASVGIVGESDGWQDLSRHGRMVNEITANGPGNLAFTAELEAARELEVVVGFGSSAEEAMTAASSTLATKFDDVRRQYDEGWSSYAQHLAEAPWLKTLPDAMRTDMLWNAAVIKTHEDKSNPGAIIASLSIPNLPAGVGSGDGKNTGGYHLVWPRDLFKSGLALLRMGDTHTALNVLQFMARMENREGRMSQNTWVDGRPFWTGEQMDQEAFPILLGVELVRAGVPLDNELKDFLNRRLARVQHSSGHTGQERWEEASGFSPNTLAIMAAALSRANDHEGAKRLLEIALSKTVSYHGPLGSHSPDNPSGHPYFVRISQSGEPDAGRYIHIANGGPSLQEYRVIDGGFMEWLRWFPNPEKVFGEQGTALATIVRNTLPLLDDPLNGVANRVGDIPVYHRYTGDAYGVNRIGGPWPILTLERALPELASSSKAAFTFLRYTRALWGEGDLCPEQLMGSQPMPYGASPLVWCHAEMIELAHKGAIGQ